MPSFNIEAAFCSITEDECYLFMQDKFVVVNYATKSDFNGPTKIVHRFPLFSETIFENGIDCAFDDSKKNVAFVFKGNQCAKTTAPQSRNARILEGPVAIAGMFPSLRRTPFENGIDASFRDRSGDKVYLFKGNMAAVFAFTNKALLSKGLISQYFPLFTATEFAKGIDAAFNTHNDGEVIFFKDGYYAQYDIISGRFFLSDYIKVIDNDWPALRDMRID